MDGSSIKPIGGHMHLQQGMVSMVLMSWRLLPTLEHNTTLIISQDLCSFEADGGNKFEVDVVIANQVVAQVDGWMDGSSIFVGPEIKSIGGLIMADKSTTRFGLNGTADVLENVAYARHQSRLLLAGSSFDYGWQKRELSSLCRTDVSGKWRAFQWMKLHWSPKSQTPPR